MRTLSQDKALCRKGILKRDGDAKNPSKVNRHMTFSDTHSTQDPAQTKAPAPRRTRVSIR